MKFSISTATITSHAGVAFRTPREITVARDPLGEGGFGIVYSVKTINGLPPPEALVFKGFLDVKHASKGLDTVRKLQDKLGGAASPPSLPLREVYSALAAAPLCSVEGTDEKGKRISGYLSANLKAAGYEELHDIRQEATLFRRYAALRFAERLDLCRQLVETFDLFDRIHYVHADFKAEAIFVNLATVKIAIIDLDSGSVMNASGEKPTTWGTPQSWLAPEVRSQIIAGRIAAKQQGPISVKVDQLGDRWSVSTALHFLLYTVEPFDHLTEISELSLAPIARLASYTPLPQNYRYAKSQRHEVDDLIRSCEHLVSPELREAFARTFTSGILRPTERASFQRWKLLLTASAQPPEIKAFQADRTFVDTSAPVMLTWITDHASIVTLDGKNVQASGTLAVIVRSPKRYILTVESPFGKTSAQIDILVASVVPRIDNFSCTLPNNTLLKIEDFYLLWEVRDAYELSIDSGVGRVTGKRHAIKGISQRTTFTLAATSWFGQRATASLVVDVDQTPPQIRFFASDTAIREDVLTPVLLSWDTSGASVLQLSPSIGQVASTGILAVDPRRRTDFELVAVSYFGVSSISKLTVDVSSTRPIIEYFRASQAIIAGPSQVTFAWSVRGSTSVKLLRQGVAEQQLSPTGTVTTDIDKASPVRLWAETVFGVVSEATINFLQPLACPAIPTFNCRPLGNEGTLGEMELSWHTTGATAVIIAPEIGRVSSSGSVRIVPTAATAYTITASAVGGRSATRELVAVPGDSAPRIGHLSCRPVIAYVGQEVVLRWEVMKAQHLSIAPFGMQDKHEGELRFIADRTSVIELEAFNRFGVATRRRLTLRVVRAPAFAKTVRLFH